MRLPACGHPPHTYMLPANVQPPLHELKHGEFIMRLKLLTAIVVGALAASAIPAAAQNVRGPLSPSGGNDHHTYQPTSQRGEFLFVPDVYAPAWTNENIRGPLSPSGGRSGIQNPASNSN
jgi:hypothetical protein